MNNTNEATTAHPGTFNEGGTNGPAISSMELAIMGDQNTDGFKVKDNSLPKNYSMLYLWIMLRKTMRLRICLLLRTLASFQLCVMPTMRERWLSMLPKMIVTLPQQKIQTRSNVMLVNKLLLEHNISSSIIDIFMV